MRLFQPWSHDTLCTENAQPVRWSQPWPYEWPLYRESPISEMVSTSTLAIWMIPCTENPHHWDGPTLVTWLTLCAENPHQWGCPNPGHMTHPLYRESPTSGTVPTQATRLMLCTENPPPVRLSQPVTWLTLCAKNSHQWSCPNPGHMTHLCIENPPLVRLYQS